MYIWLDPHNLNPQGVLSNLGCRIIEQYEKKSRKFEEKIAARTTHRTRKCVSAIEFRL